MATQNSLNDNLGVLTTLGDLLVGGGSNTNVRLAVGANTYVLTADSTQPYGLAWEALPSSTPSWTRTFLLMGA